LNNSGASTKLEPETTWIKIIFQDLTVKKQKYQNSCQSAVLALGHRLNGLFWEKGFWSSPYVLPGKLKAAQCLK